MRLLLVEDERKLAVSLKKALEAEKYAVDWAEDGQQAYEKATVEEYDVVLLDVGLPKIDGFSLAKKLRAEEVQTPILMLTARDASSDKVTGLDTGADDYVVKPFDFNELLARIRALLRRGKGELEAIELVCDSLTLDPARQSVKRAGKRIEVTAKEYAIIEFLLRHRDQIISKTQILEHVWDETVDPFSNVVDVYVGYVRAKIDKAFPKEKIILHTLKGRGYRLSAEK